VGDPPNAGERRRCGLERIAAVDPLLVDVEQRLELAQARGPLCVESVSGHGACAIDAFHADTGSDDIHYRVARLLGNCPIGQCSESGALQTNDNALPESIHAAVVARSVPCAGYHSIRSYIHFTVVRSTAALQHSRIRKI